MISHPEYDRLVAGFMDRPCVDHWRVIQGWCEEHGEWAGAFLWQRRVAYYPPILLTLLQALTGDEHATYGTTFGRYAFIARNGPKRLSYSVVLAGSLRPPVWWGNAKWHYFHRRKDASCPAPMNAIRLVNQMIQGELKELSFYGLYSQPALVPQQEGGA